LEGPRAKGRRRTQGERRAAMERALLNAAVACIGKYGVGGATVERIARRAKATGGAVQHHFGKRGDLLLAVIDDFGTRLEEVSGNALPVGPSIEERVAAINAAYWDLLSSEHYLAVIQILLAAQADPRLYSQIFKRLKLFENELDKRWIHIFDGSGIAPERIAEVRHVVMAAFRGLSIRMVYRRDRTRWAGELQLLANMTTAALSGGLVS
jgi:AcrR family transcriptional regulator